MAFGIPNAAAAAFPAQAAPDAVDIDILVAGIRGTGVITGCSVTEGSTSTNMLLAVAAGTMRLAGSADVTVGAATATIPTAHATLPRFDLVVASNTGVVSVTAGTAATSPVFPAVPAANVALAAVWVPAGDTGIANNQIIDKRVTPPELPAGSTASESVIVVNHGTDPNVARPAGWGTVIWKGSAVPVNFSTGDDIRINPT